MGQAVANEMSLNIFKLAATVATETILATNALLPVLIQFNKFQDGCHIAKQISSQSVKPLGENDTGRFSNFKSVKTIHSK